MHDHHHDHEAEEHDRGLSHDLPTLLSRRRALSVLGGTTLAAALGACGGGSDSRSNGSDSGPAKGGVLPADDGGDGTGTPPAEPEDGDASTRGGEIPEETSGPYPGDGSNGVNVLTESGIVRSDITRSFGSASGIAAGVPLTIWLTVLDAAKDSTPLAGAAVYVWHCTIDGAYSLYSGGITEENYLRGVQATDASGKATFNSIFPAAYSGRWPHIHFEVYESLDAATSAGSRLRTSQLALPKDACDLVYATDGYSQSVTNLAQTSLDTDNVFSDGHSLQLATATGEVTSGLTAALKVPV
jgi:protocatechuate 3,4-dioxygenase beta subunit